MNWLLGLLAAIGVSIGGIGGGGAPASGPALPSQCPGTIGDYNVIDKSGKNASVTGTDGADFIIIKSGTIRGEGGNDCLVVTSKSAIVYGGVGDDVILKTCSGCSGGQAKGDYNISPFPIYGDTPINLPCDDEAGECIYPIIDYLPEGFDRCIGAWQLIEGCEATN